MAKKKIEVNVTYKYELEIDEDDSIVKEYEDEKELLWDCASRHFGTGTPVINNGGVQVLDRELVEVVKA